MYRKVFTDVPLSEHCEKVNIDQYAAEPFNIGESGFPANDIELFNRASSIEEMEALARKLEIMRTSENVDVSNLSLQEQFDMIKPRVLQTPAECERFVGWLTQRSLNAARAAGLDDFQANEDNKVETVEASTET